MNNQDRAPSDEHSINLSSGDNQNSDTLINSSQTSSVHTDTVHPGASGMGSTMGSPTVTATAQQDSANSKEIIDTNQTDENYRDKNQSDKNKSNHGEPLLDALVILTKLHNQPRSPEVLVAGLPFHKRNFSADLFIRAAERIHFEAQLVERPLKQINNIVCPCVLIMNDEQVYILVEVQDDNKLILINSKQTDLQTQVADITEFESQYSGFALLVKPSTTLPKRGFDAHGSAVREKHWFWSVMMKSLPAYTEVIIASVLINCFALAVPLFTRNVYDRVVPNQAVETMWVLVIGVCIVLSFDFIMRILRGYFIDMASKNIDIQLSSKIFEQVQGIRMADRPRSVGAFTNTVQSYETFRDFITSTTLTVLVDLPFAILFLIVIALIAGDLALVPAIAIPIVIGIGFIIQWPLTRLTKESFAHSSEKQATLIETLSNAETVKGTSAESFMQRRWEEVVAVSARHGVKLKMISGLSSNFAMLAQQLTTIIMIIIGVYKITAGELTTGTLIACSILTGRALAPMGQVANLMTRYYSARTAMDSLNNIMKLPTERCKSRSPLNRPNWNGNIEFQHVNFSYPDEAVPSLQDINFRIKSGERVAIIGRIGSGKTSIAKMILGLYQASGGNVLIDGTDILQLDPTQLRHNIGYVPQDVSLFFGTVKENIVISAPYVDDDEVVRVSHIAGIDDFVNAHPLGYDMQVGERGCQMSGGQRQSIAIARALLENPGVVLMDEPTSNMDDNSENRFKIRLQEYLTNETLIIVTHKRSMLSLVDRIIVVDRGRIIADGEKDRVLAALRGEST